MMVKYMQITIKMMTLYKKEVIYMKYAIPKFLTADKIKKIRETVPELHLCLLHNSTMRNM